jgi:GntR family transcriptional regulator
MQLWADTESPIPIRRQLPEQAKRFIDAGCFPRNHARPSIRQLAGTLAVNPNTIARVIADLQREGCVQARRGTGIFVTSQLPGPASIACLRRELGPMPGWARK